MMILNERVISPWMKRVTFQDSDYSKIASFYYPVFLMARKAYSEQVGAKRQEFGKIGDNSN